MNAAEKNLIRAKFLKVATMKTVVSKITETILSIERSANERWNRGNCTGYLEIYSEDILPQADELWMFSSSRR
jgi:hypothetical protein